MLAKWETPPKHWRVRAKAADGLVVTLGRYITEDEAHAACRQFAEAGGYRNLAVQPIEPRPEPTPPAGHVQDPSTAGPRPVGKQPPSRPA